MSILLLALVVGVLFATGTYLLLQRSPIKLILGLSLLSHGVNLLLFSTSGLRRGDPPIVADKAAFNGNIANFVDPLPQALILTAIVISFGFIAFTVVLMNRRNALTQTAQGRFGDEDEGVASSLLYSPIEHYLSGLDDDPDDYQWLEYTLVDEYKQQAAQRRAVQQNGAPPQSEQATPVQKTEPTR